MFVCTVSSVALPLFSFFTHTLKCIKTNTKPTPQFVYWSSLFSMLLLKLFFFCTIITSQNHSCGTCGGTWQTPSEWFSWRSLLIYSFAIQFQNEWTFFLFEAVVTWQRKNIFSFYWKLVYRKNMFSSSFFSFGVGCLQWNFEENLTAKYVSSEKKSMNKKTSLNWISYHFISWCFSSNPSQLFFFLSVYFWIGVYMNSGRISRWLRMYFIALHFLHSAQSKI